MRARRLLIALMFAALGTAETAVAARADEDGATQSDNAQSDSGEAGQGDAQKSDNSGNASAKEPAPTSTPNAMSQDDARRAVDAAQALPLDTILSRFRRSGDFTLVDVALVSRRSRLYYVLEYVQGDGSVHKALIDAQNGRRVE